MKFSEFKKKDNNRQIFLNRKGQLMVVSDGVVDTVEMPLPYLNHLVVLEDNLTLFEIFIMLEKNELFFSMIISDTSFKAYLEAFKVIKNKTLEKSKFFGLTLSKIISYQCGETEEDKKIRLELENKTPTKLKQDKKTKVRILGHSEEETDSIFRELERERRQEIKKHLKNETYQKYIDDNNYVSVSNSVSISGYEEVYNSKRELTGYNHDKIINYSVSGVSFSELLTLPVILTSTVVSNDISYQKETVTQLELSLFDFFHALIWELSWESPDSRENGELKKMLKEKMGKVELPKK